MDIARQTADASGQHAGSQPVAAFFGRWPVVLAVLDSFALAIVAAVEWSVPHVLLAIYLVTIAILFASTGLYSNRLRVVALDHLPTAVGAITLAAMGIVTVNFLVLNLPLAPAIVLKLWGVTTAAISGTRVLATPIHRLAVRAAPKRKTLVVGSGHSATLVATKVDAHPELGLSVVGFVDEGPRQTVRGRHEPLLGRIKDLTRVIEEQEAEVVVLAFVKNNYAEILKALYQAEPRVEVLIMPRYFEFLSAGVKIDDLAGMPMLGMNRRDPSFAQRLVKRTEDLLLAGLLLLVALPILPLVALAIRIDSPGPAFFKSPRMGKGFRRFDAYKFRSMTMAAHNDREALEKMKKNDPRALKDLSDKRITRVGRFLRKSSIDELPQLFNIVKGDMSLVGPRPALVEEVPAYDEWQKKRLSVRPGLTGLWQVNGRSDLPFDEKLWLDFMYIDSWSPWLDFRILLETIPAVISTRGAY